MSRALAKLRKSCHTTSQFVPLKATAGLFWSLAFLDIRIGSGSITSARLFRRAARIADPPTCPGPLQTTRKPSAEAAALEAYAPERTSTPSGFETMPVALTREP